MKKTLVLFLFLSFVFLLGCSERGINEIEKVLDNVRALDGGKWEIISINGQTPNEIFNTGADETVVNSTANHWTFQTDGTWVLDLRITTTFPDTPELNMVLSVIFTGIHTYESGIVSIVEENVTADVMVSPAENTEIVLGVSESDFEQQYADALRTQDTVSGTYSWKYSYSQHQLMLSDADGVEIKLRLIDFLESE